MSNIKDLTIVPKALESVITVDAKSLVTIGADDVIKTGIEKVQFFIRRSFTDTLNIGYWLVQIKTHSAHGAEIENYKKAGFSERAAMQYLSIYKAFSELDSKKALKAFEKIEVSKLRELSRLSKQNLNQLAKQPELIDSIKNQTTKEFKTQLLPGLIQGNIENLSSLQHQYQHTKKELEIAENKAQQRKQELTDQQQQFNEVTPKLISDVKIKSFSHSQAALFEIEQLNNLARSIISGRHNNEFSLHDPMHQTDVMSVMSNTARALLANASEFYRYVNEHLTPSEASLDPMSEDEIYELFDNL